ncbi:MAG: lysophospholipid acyltransferase family protein [Thiohalocapsa sp.]
MLFQVVFVFAVVGYSVVIILVGRRITRESLLGLAASWSRVSLGALKRLCRLDYRIVGIENLPHEPCILMAKHQSAWETIAIPGIIPRPQAWVLKQELMRVPFFGGALRSFRPIAIDRKAGRKAIRQLLDEGKAQLEQGQSILVFPEGTRVGVGEAAAFNIGGALLAEKSGAPVVPIAHNAGVFWKRRALRKLPGRIDMVIGPPIDPAGRSAKEINTLVKTWIDEAVRGLPQVPSDLRQS